MAEEYEIVIGLEVHVELATRTKIFCGCTTAFGGAPNTHTCPVCTGMPGTLPVLNRQVVEYAMAVGLATNCTISQYSRFDRKNYFYPDNPQNYQISQLYLPICREGYVEIETQNEKEGEATTKKIRIHEIHMEEDAGKLIHSEQGEVSLVDYNRAGVPLIEIVSEPDMRSAEEVIAYLEKLRLLIQYLGASDCKLQEGSMRADVNLSVHKKGEPFGVRTEMKNLNSFHGITHAIDHEAKRQIDLLNAGNQVVMETRRWDEQKNCSFSMRSKEDARDYRYFPDPDLPVLRIDQGWIDSVRETLPEFREEKSKRYKAEYELPEYDIGILTEDKYLADFFEATVACGSNPKKVSNWLMGETLRLLREKNKDAKEIVFTPKHLSELIELVEKKEINNTVAKEVFALLFEEDFAPDVYVKEKGLATVSDVTALKDVVVTVMEENPQSVSDYRAGKEKAIGFLVGQTMKKMKGQADPGKVTQLLKELL